jgi:acylphosphatase
MSMADQARELHIQGWCRNLPDGRVEAWMQGTPDNMARMLEWVHQGPAGADVAQVDIENQAVLEPMLSETIQTFEIRK